MRGIFEVHGLQAREQLLLFAVRERAASGVTALLVAALRACGGIASLEAALAELDGLHRELDRGARRALRLLAPTNARLDADERVLLELLDAERGDEGARAERLAAWLVRPRAVTAVRCHARRLALACRLPRGLDSHRQSTPPAALAEHDLENPTTSTNQR